MHWQLVSGDGRLTKSLGITLGNIGLPPVDKPDKNTDVNEIQIKLFI